MRLALPKIRLPSLSFKKKTASGISIHMTDKFLRLLHLNKEEKPVFPPIEEMWEDLSDVEKKKKLSEIVNKYNLSGSTVITCVPADEGLLKFQKLPSRMSNKDLMEALNWFINVETSQIKENTVHDYYFLESKPGDKYIRVVVAIARTDFINKLKDIIEGSGLRIGIVDYEVISIINYGLHKQLPVPFSILYVDYYEAILAYYSEGGISYNKINFNYKYYMDNRDKDIFNSFVIETRNTVVINELSNIYVAGPIIADEEAMEEIMVNLPVLGILDLEELPPNFFIPYILSVRGLEE